jgi:ABC-type Fe3+/spermidine/putrescine transport system ATPase subunit
VHAVVRQESIRLEPAGEGAGAGSPNRFAATIVFHAFAGQAHHYVVQLADGRELEVAAPGASAPLARGDRTLVAWRPEDVTLLPGGEPGPGGAR